MKQKLALGTVQFGLKYGINNSSGQVSEKEIQNILTLCQSEGVDVLDTAFTYGNSEQALGNVGVADFKIISKLPTNRDMKVLKCFQASCQRLNVNQLYGYMLHNFSIYQNEKSVWKELVRLKKEGFVQKIGISLYAPKELEILWKDGVELDIVQVPYNLFDRRFESYFPKMKEKNIEIHTRSTFLQGLFFKLLKHLPIHFESVREKLNWLNGFSKENSLSIVEICLGFVAANEFIDKMVLGVDSSEQLKSNIESSNKRFQKIDWEALAFLEEHNLNITNPSLWKI